MLEYRALTDSVIVGIISLWREVCPRQKVDLEDGIECFKVAPIRMGVSRLDKMIGLS